MILAPWELEKACFSYLKHDKKRSSAGVQILIELSMKEDGWHKAHECMRAAGYAGQRSDYLLFLNQLIEGGYIHHKKEKVDGWVNHMIKLGDRVDLVNQDSSDGKKMLQIRSCLNRFMVDHASATPFAALILIAVIRMKLYFGGQIVDYLNMKHNPSVVGRIAKDLMNSGCVHTEPLPRSGFGHKMMIQPIEEF